MQGVQVVWTVLLPARHAVPSMINVLAALLTTTCLVCHVSPYVDAVYELKISKTSVPFAVKAHQMPHAGYSLYPTDHTVLVMQTTTDVN